MDLSLTDRIAEAVYSTAALLAFLTLMWLVFEVQGLREEVQQLGERSSDPPTDERAWERPASHPSSGPRVR